MFDVYKDCVASASKFKNIKFLIFILAPKQQIEHLLTTPNMRNKLTEYSTDFLMKKNPHNFNSDTFRNLLLTVVNYAETYQKKLLFVICHSFFSTKYHILCVLLFIQTF